MKNKNLIITALHGNEGFSVDIVKEVLSRFKKSNFEMLIGNPRALKKDVRFIEQDLNRIAPGINKSPIYELNRASELVKLSKKFGYILDIHGTNANTGIFIIITNPKIENLLLAASLPIKNVVIWANSDSIQKGPITQHVLCPAIEIECGPKNDLIIAKELKRILKEVLFRKDKSINYLLKNASKQFYFQVYGDIEDVDTSEMKEFQEVTEKGEHFYPLLINSYKKNSTRKMKKIDLFSILCYKE